MAGSCLVSPESNKQESTHSEAEYFEARLDRSLQQDVRCKVRCRRREGLSYDRQGIEVCAFEGCEIRFDGRLTDLRYQIMSPLDGKITLTAKKTTPLTITEYQLCATRAQVEASLTELPETLEDRIVDA